MTRIQKEHDTPELAARYQQLDLSHYKLTLDRVSHMKDYAPILQPIPAR